MRGRIRRSATSGLRSERSRDQLSLANRWLLAVLVSHANEFGVVDGLGMADLRLLTGMTEFRLKTQLSRLMDMGVIRSYAPGLSRSLFTGVRVRSSYVLDLYHPLLGKDVDRGGVVVIDEETEELRESGDPVGWRY